LTLKVFGVYGSEFFRVYDRIEQVNHQKHDKQRENI